MNYSEIIAECPLKNLADISEKVDNAHRIDIIRYPAEGMVMARHIDPLEKTPFYIGEVLVTECEVAVDGIVGYACILGKQDERSLYGAVIDAVLHSALPVKSEVEALLAKEAVGIRKRWAREENMVSGTRVNFDVR